jgi:hypothetical protein
MIGCKLTCAGPKGHRGHNGERLQDLRHWETLCAGRNKWFVRELAADRLLLQKMWIEAQQGTGANAMPELWRANF